MALAAGQPGQHGISLMDGALEGGIINLEGGGQVELGSLGPALLAGQALQQQQRQQRGAAGCAEPSVWAGATLAARPALHSRYPTKLWQHC